MNRSTNLIIIMRKFSLVILTISEKRSPGIATEQEHIQCSLQRTAASQVKAFQLFQFFRCKMSSLAFHILDLVLTERIAVQIKQIFIDCQIDVTLQMLHMFGNRIPVIFIHQHIMLKIAKEIKTQIIKTHICFK